MKTRSTSTQHISALQRLGLTPLEASIYAFLLGERSATGYRVAQAVGKPIGSTYKALEGLESKGAVMASDDSGARSVRATPIKEFLAARRAELEGVGAILSGARGPDVNEPLDERVYALNDRDQVLERCRSMLGEATDFCIITATPLLAALLTPAMRSAASRAVHVGLKAFSPIEIPGVRVALDPRGPVAVARGPGEWLSVTSDAREMLIAIFDHEVEQINTATWTAHAHLNWAFFTGMGSDYLLAAIRTALDSGTQARELQEMIASMAPFQTPRSDSKRQLMWRYRSSNPNRRGDRSTS